MNTIKIGIVGTDSSHCVAFTKLYNDNHEQHHVPGAKVICAKRCFSEDFKLSYSREEGFSRTLEQQYGVKLVDWEQLREQCDAIMLQSADGRVHLEQFKQMVAWKKPIFIDKPLALTFVEATEIVNLASKHGTPIMSCSSLRYAVALEDGLKQIEANGHKIKHVMIKCPLAIEPTQGRYFWYAIHGAEMLFRILGSNYTELDVKLEENYEVLIGKWENGVVGEVKCIQDDQPFEVHIETDDRPYHIYIADGAVPFYASLLQHMVTFFRTGKSPISTNETLAIIQFLESADHQYETLEAIK